MKKRILLIGPVDSGKSTFCSACENEAGPIRKVANIVYSKRFIDTPGVYLESPWMHKHLISLQQTASFALFFFPLGRVRKIYPPGFAKVFRVPKIGILTYKDHPAACDLEKGKKVLQETGVMDMFSLDINNRKDLEMIKKQLNERGEK
ncbi:EutP/PduV family microcompartment system protein [Enterococcus hirae]|jgi:ethanolamine utilization protein EutP|nr:hypothetical protein [Enterococcaceae bacterium]MDM8213692.1 EutP/PduV family microcompartment system protein [Enterococcus hirae]